MFRAGLAAIHPGQREAALAAGMTPWMSLRFIVLPQNAPWDLAGREGEQ